MKPFHNQLRLVIGSAFGLGLMPIAPGSFGALLGVGLHVATVLCLSAAWQRTALAVCLAVVCALHFLLTPWAQAFWKESDPRHFVLDEVAGYLIIPLLLGPGRTTMIATSGFVLFRVFDIIKLPGARYVDRNWHGAWGVLLDDIIAGLYAVAVLGAAIWLKWDY